MKSRVSSSKSAFFSKKTTTPPRPIITSSIASGRSAAAPIVPIARRIERSPGVRDLLSVVYSPEIVDAYREAKKAAIEAKELIQKTKEDLATDLTPL